MEEQKMIQQAAAKSKALTPSECIFPKLDLGLDWSVRNIRDEEGATRIALSICRDIFKVLYNDEYTIAAKDQNYWWAQALCSTGEVGILRSITKGSVRWSSLALRYILRYLKSAQSLSGLAQNAPQLFTLMLDQSLAQTAQQVQNDQSQAEKEWENQNVVSFGKNEDYAFTKDEKPHRPKMVPNVVSKIYELANATLDHFTDSGALYVYDSMPLLDAEDFHEILTPEYLRLRMLNNVSVLGQEKTLSMNMYLDYSGSMTTRISIGNDTLDYARLCGYIGDILWRHGIIHNVYLFNGKIHEGYRDKKGVFRAFKRPDDFLSIRPSGGTDFTNIVKHSRNRPAVVITDGQAMAEPNLKMNDKLMWVIFSSKNYQYSIQHNEVLKPFIKRGKVVGIDPDTLKLYEILPEEKEELWRYRS